MGVEVPGRGGLENLGEGDRSTWEGGRSTRERGVKVPESVRLCRRYPPMERLRTWRQRDYMNDNTW